MNNPLLPLEFEGELLKWNNGIQGYSIKCPLDNLDPQFLSDLSGRIIKLNGKYFTVGSVEKFAVGIYYKGLIFAVYSLEMTDKIRICNETTINTSHG